MSTTKKITMRERVKTMSDIELDQYILGKLGYKGEYNEEYGQSIHLRFDRTGISDPDFKFIKENKDIWDLFIECGIYDRLCLFYMDVYKGGLHIFYKWFEDNDYLYQNTQATVNVMTFDTGTREIIKDVIKFFCIDNQDKAIRRMN